MMNFSHVLLCYSVETQETVTEEFVTQTQDQDEVRVISLVNAICNVLFHWSMLF